MCRNLIIIFSRSSGSPSALCFEALGANRSPRITDDPCTPPYSKYPSLELQQPRLSPFRLGGIVLPSQGHTQQQQQLRSKEPFRLASGLVSDAERQKRDSGVLVEEQDASDNSGSPFCVSMASDDQLTIVR